MGSVYLRSNAYTFVAGVRDPAAAAYGSYTDMKDSGSGFGQRA